MKIATQLNVVLFLHFFFVLCHEPIKKKNKSQMITMIWSVKKFVLVTAKQSNFIIFIRSVCFMNENHIPLLLSFEDSSYISFTCIFTTERLIDIHTYSTPFIRLNPLSEAVS